MLKSKREKILIIDFGSQYTHLIAKRIRQLGVYSEIIAHNAKIALSNVKGLILSGGPMSVLEKESPKIEKVVLEEAIKKKIPVLGVCYGHQLIAYYFGGEVRGGDRGEYGRYRFRVLGRSRLFEGLPKEFDVWMNHSEYVVSLPKNFLVTGRTENSKIASFEMDNLIFGLQFHPEVKHTQYGLRIIDNFIRITGIERKWSEEAYLENKIDEVRSIVKNKSVLVATSGGVDSLTVAVLLKHAIGPEKVHVVFIDTGFMREGEPEWVLRILRDFGFRNIHFIDAKDDFLKELVGVEDPKEKRKIFSKIYFEILDRVATKIMNHDKNLEYIAQGTIYPDKVESAKAGKNKSKIKDHHNVAGVHIKKLKLLEPLDDLYKDEVRRLAILLGIPKEIAYRQPFPGPGLLIRIVGKVTRDKIEIIRKAHKIVEEEMTKYKPNDLWQIFPVLLSLKSTGIKGDAGVYQYMIALRAVVSEDGMTADYARLSWEFLDSVAKRLTSELEVSRVLYDITTKPPATIEFE